MQLIMRYPGQKFVGIATRENGELLHSGFTLVNAIPKPGDKLFDRVVAEVLTNEELLKERSALAVNPIEAVAVLGD